MSSQPGVEVEPTADRPIASLSISHALRSALVDAGYRTTADILAISHDDLCAELGIKSDVAFDLLRQCADPPGPSRPSSPSREPSRTQASQPATMPSATAASLLSTASLPRFSTCINALDNLLGDFSPSSSSTAHLGHENGASKGKGKARGITTGQSVEIAGPPGIGKTTIAVGMVLEARLEVCERALRRQTERERKKRRGEGASRGRSESRVSAEQADGDGGFGGDGDDDTAIMQADLQEGQVLIVDTEGGIPPDKLYKYTELITREAEGITPSDMLDGIHIVRIATQVQMVAFVNLLDEWLTEHPSVNLIIIDSLSFHFRQPSMDLSTRRRIMDMVKLQIGKATTVHQCAVVVTSQMATKLLSAEGKRVNFDTGEKAVLMPQLGEAWQTAKTIRIALFRGQPGDELRYAHVDPTADAEGRGWARFDIDADGLPVDVESV